MWVCLGFNHSLDNEPIIILVVHTYFFPNTQKNQPIWVGLRRLSSINPLFSFGLDALTP